VPLAVPASAGGTAAWATLAWASGPEAGGPVSSCGEPVFPPGLVPGAAYPRPDDLAQADHPPRAGKPGSARRYRARRSAARGRRIPRWPARGWPARRWPARGRPTRRPPAPAGPWPRSLPGRCRSGTRRRPRTHPLTPRLPRSAARRAGGTVVLPRYRPPAARDPCSCPALARAGIPAVRRGPRAFRPGPRAPVVTLRFAPCPVRPVCAAGHHRTARAARPARAPAPAGRPAGAGVLAHAGAAEKRRRLLPPAHPP
jgi:hypothetical protein